MTDAEMKAALETAADLIAMDRDAEYVTLARAVLAYDRLFRHEHDEACPVLSGPDGPDKLCECGFGERYRDIAAQLAERDVEVASLTVQLGASQCLLAASQREADRLRHGVPIEGDLVCPAEAELSELRRHVAHNDEEYKTMKDVLRAEHAACQELRATVARLTGELSATLSRCENDLRAAVAECDRQRDEAHRQLADMQDNWVKSESESTRLRSALKEACDIFDSVAPMVGSVNAPTPWPAHTRIQELLRLAADGSE